MGYLRGMPLGDINYTERAMHSNRRMKNLAVHQKKLSTDYGVGKLEDKKEWYHKPLWVAVIAIVLSTLINQVIFHCQRKDVLKVQLVSEIFKGSEKMEMPELPLTIIDKQTANQLYIGRPIAHPAYYEFPITLNDGKGSYRIDRYDIINKYAGKTIYIEKAPAE